MFLAYYAVEQDSYVRNVDERRYELLLIEQSQTDVIGDIRRHAEYSKYLAYYKKASVSGSCTWSDLARMLRHYSMCKSVVAGYKFQIPVVGKNIFLAFLFVRSF